MKIFNVRQGFATNSSSSHSILELPADTTTTSDESIDFNWNFFTAADLESKENYFAKTVAINLNNMGWKDSAIKTFLNNLFENKNIYESIKDVSIDHQSIITLPRNWDNSDINIEFINEFNAYLKKANVVIVGGNDNTEEEHILISPTNKSSLDNLPTESSTNHLVARKDEDHWVIFNRINGTKLRISFDNIEKPTKASTPELVDIKITDFCPYDCSFCYQDSTLKGQHSSIDNIKKILSELKDKKILEIAYGGGETTLHPQFIEILRLTKESQIIPNFTTKNFNLLRQENAKEIIELCGGMAFSVTSLKDFEKVRLSLIDFSKKDKLGGEYSYRDPSEIDNDKPWEPVINFQIVLGTMDDKDLEKLLTEIGKLNLRTTLLGYKENGRGNQFAPHDYSNWLDIVEKVQKKNYIKVSIDTALAAEYQDLLLIRKVDERSFHITEGNFSAYIDAVNMKIAPSSYVGLEQSKNFDDNWLKSWRNMSATPTFKKTIKINSK